MLILLADSLILFFITLRIGILAHYLLERLFRVRIQSDLMGLFLVGVIACSFYFNIFSFWLPVNYFSLIPLIILSFSIGYWLRENVREVRQTLRQAVRFVFSPANRYITLSLMAVLFIFWVIYPINLDSAGYHYLSIRWYERYKAVPGLANIQGRLAFNPISFIFQAPYSFTDLAGQSLYPFNGVLLSLFFAWLLMRVLRGRGTPEGLGYVVLLLLLYRAMLSNISSPSPDALVDVCLGYSLIVLFERLLRGRVELTLVLMPCLIILFSLMAKLYSFPMLPLIPFLFFLLPETERKGRVVLRFMGVGLLLFVPWVIRTYILSGYIFYPLPWFNFFHPDWQVSLNVLKFNFYNVHGICETPSLSGSYLSWLLRSFGVTSLAVTIAATLSPLLWILFYKRAGRVSLTVIGMWLMLYAGVWIWWFTSAVFRFGAILLTLTLLFPLLAWLSGRTGPGGLSDWSGAGRLSGRIGVRPRVYSVVTQVVFIFTALYYVQKEVRPGPHAPVWKECWLYPLRDLKYKNNKATFPYTTLRSGVKLYLEDKTHECINADLTCRLYYAGEIDLRGTRIEEGFRVVKDETTSYPPFVIIKR